MINSCLNRIIPTAWLVLAGSICSGTMATSPNLPAIVINKSFFSNEERDIRICISWEIKVSGVDIRYPLIIFSTFINLIPLSENEAPILVGVVPLVIFTV